MVTAANEASLSYPRPRREGGSGQNARLGTVALRGRVEAGRARPTDGPSESIQASAGWSGDGRLNRQRRGKPDLLEPLMTQTRPGRSSCSPSLAGYLERENRNRDAARVTGKGGWGTGPAALHPPSRESRWIVNRVKAHNLQTTRLPSVPHDPSAGRGPSAGPANQPRRIHQPSRLKHAGKGEVRNATCAWHRDSPNVPAQPTGGRHKAEIKGQYHMYMEMTISGMDRL